MPLELIVHLHGVIIVVFAAVIVIAVASLTVGKHISLAADACFGRRPRPRQFEPIILQFDPEGISSSFSLGSQGWSFSWPRFPGPLELKVIVDEKGRLVLQAGGRSFTFGPIQTRWNDPKTPSYQFAPEPGDVVSLTRTIGRLPWLTPFTFSWLGGASPKMKRFLYDRLTWTKASGPRLKVLWRGEEWFYPGSGWADTWNNRLTRIIIRDGRVAE